MYKIFLIAGRLLNKIFNLLTDARINPKNYLFGLPTILIWDLWAVIKETAAQAATRQVTSA